MKKLLWLVLPVLFLSGCLSKGMNIEYMTPSEVSFTADPVFLQVQDRRQDTNLLTPAVKEKEFFQGIRNQVSLSAKAPSGRVVKLPDSPLDRVFQEAFKLRFESLGIGMLPEQRPDRPSLIIEIEKITLDLDGRVYRAMVQYNARFLRDGKQFHAERVTASRDQPYLVGKAGGEKALGEALTEAVNHLSLEKFKPGLKEQSLGN